MRLFNGMKLLLLSHTGKASFHLKLGNDGCYAPVKPRKEVLTKEYLFNRWLTVKQLLGFWQNSNCAVLLAAYWMIGQTATCFRVEEMVAQSEQFWVYLSCLIISIQTSWWPLAIAVSRQFLPSVVTSRMSAPRSNNSRRTLTLPRDAAAIKAVHWRLN